MEDNVFERLVPFSGRGKKDIARVLEMAAGHAGGPDFVQAISASAKHLAPLPSPLPPTPSPIAHPPAPPTSANPPIECIDENVTTYKAGRFVLSVTKRHLDMMHGSVTPRRSEPDSTSANRPLTLDS